MNSTTLRQSSQVGFSTAIDIAAPGSVIP